MRIKSVRVENFRGIRSATIEDISDFVVLAGQNGSGKSCVLDAIRLIKSVYGGYQPNEYQHWFSEFQIDIMNEASSLAGLFNDPERSLELSLAVELHDDEIAFLQLHAERLIEAQAWKTIMPELYEWRSLRSTSLAAHTRARRPEVEDKKQQDLELFRREIGRRAIEARVSIAPGQSPEFEQSALLELLFNTYEPQHLGIIDYHGPNRNYAREQVTNLNVNVESFLDSRRQGALYNYSAKYSNVKSEMAALYVREALAAKAGATHKEEDLTTTLKELFSTFFPDKEFLGLRPMRDGRLHFPVRIGGRDAHDLDDLSSGEKEILYGYLVTTHPLRRCDSGVAG